MTNLVRRRLATALAFALAGSAAHAGTHGIRIEFAGDWGTDNGGAIGSAACPGTSVSDTLVHWNGFDFSGDSDPNQHFDTDTYCQHTVPYNPDIPDDPYFSGASFTQGDEPGLAYLIGANTNNSVSGLRYTYLGGPRFSQPNGFQWAFYFFPRKVTVAGLYGLTAIVLDDQFSYIDSGFVSVWSGGSDGYDGRYFCFQDVGTVAAPNVVYIGTWSGDLADTSNTCLRKLGLVFEDDFED